MHPFVRIIAVGSLLTLISGTSLAAQDCDRDRAHAQVEAARTAWREARMDDALGLLHHSVEDCGTYEAYEQLGEYQVDAAPQHGRRYLRDAVDSFVEAEALAPDNQLRAHALYEYGLLLDADGQPSNAVPLLDKAHTLDPANAEIAHLQSRVEAAAEHMSPEQAHRALSDSLYKPLRLAAVDSGGGAGSASVSQPAASGAVTELPFVAIHFVTNSTVVDRISESNVNVLADALAAPDRRGNHFLLIGHADQRGTDAYNVLLSTHRAEAVSALLTERQPSLKGRIVTEGHGAHEPLNTGTDAHAMWMNRRLQVFVR